MNEVKMPRMSQTTYDRVQWMVESLLPAVASLLYLASLIWDFFGDQNIVGVLVLAIFFLGLAIRANRRRFNAVNPSGVGSMVVKVDDDGMPTVGLELEKTPEELAGLQSIRFDVRRENA